MVSLVENLYYIERKRGVWGAEPPSAAGEKPAAGAKTFGTKVKITPPLRFWKNRWKGGFLSELP